MRLAKPCLDIGLFVTDVDASRAFYEGVVGLPYEELLKIGRGHHQHRLGLRGAVLKLNSVRDPLPTAPGSLLGLVIAHDAVTGPELLTDPDGLPVTLVPPGHDGVDTVGVVWASRDPHRVGSLLAGGIGAEAVDTGFGRMAWRVGTTLLRVVHDPEAQHTEQRAVGFRYLTVQVFDVVAAHRTLVELGWTEAMAPLKLGELAAISFVRDPDGVWLEISQRASLTGALPDRL